ncbi:ARM repeat superfamily protein [Zea mays]|uniref:ARM repeat superfamily protein n=1 Tax=Zea mays TaxID=4577 RepID=A0A1D6LD03_MAIZE|nr:ARM repeat superfamily protein [Zea mays]
MSRASWAAEGCAGAWAAEKVERALDQRRMKVVEIGGAQELLNVLEGAKDDKTRKETLKALAALSKSGE